MSLPRLRLKPHARAVIERRHPWIYREAVQSAPKSLSSGSLVMLQCEDAPPAYGIWDADSALTIRVLSHDDAPSQRWFKRRAQRALALRKSMFPDNATDAYRLIHGEGDGLGGLVVDRYGPYASLKADGLAAHRFYEQYLDALGSLLASQGLEGGVLRKPDHKRRTEVLPWFGQEVDSRVFVQEHGMQMQVDILRGQKTGAFLDQRENRLRVRQLARGKSVLNLFSYAGGFSLAAALGEARTTTSVDIADGGHRAAEQSFAANGLSVEGHKFVTSDVFRFLEKARLKRKRWDVVISDPPNFSPNQKSLKKAMAAYRRLHRMAAEVVAPGGLLCAASCSSHVDYQSFLHTLEGARPEPLQIVETHGQPADHPTLASWPEGRYLKFVLCRVV